MHLGTTLTFFDTETTIARDTLLDTVPVLCKQYEVEFEVLLTTLGNMANIIHLTIGGNGDQYGDRTPGVWLYQKGKLRIDSAVNGDHKYTYKPSTNLVAGQWIKFNIAQVRLVSGEYQFTIQLDGKEVHRVKNTDAREFKNVKIYASSPWLDAQPGKIRNLLIVNAGNI